YMLVTQGETMGTRRWMPCFDEPAMRATLSLSIRHPSNMVARSNAPPVKESGNSGYRTTKFETTRPISPYLFALSITDYEEKSEDVNGIQVSVVSNKKDLIDLALSSVKLAVESYFNALSIKATHVFDKMGVESLEHLHIYHHEMMHQYFGNLITLSWWDEVWINEGLSTVYEIDAVDGIGAIEAVENLRRRRKQHMNHFLNKLAYKAVTGEDFLSTIREIADKHYKDHTPQLAYKMTKDFLELPGFPLVKINRNGRKLEFSQVRFVRGLLD
ncbi:hypothetical protein PFISCL1PPCAC_2167, partial [Pristionchus fissidentatus]